MPVIAAGFRYGVKDSAGGMTVFGAELVGEQREFCDGLLNHGLRRPVHIQLVVLDAVDVESVETWASSANRTSGAEDTTLLRRCSRSENCQFLYVASQSIEGQVGYDFAAKRGLQFRRLGID